MNNRILILPIILLMFTGCTGKRPELGVTDGKFSPCPATPNCVSSQAIDKDHFIEPIVLERPPSLAKKSLLDVLMGLKNGRIVTNEENYFRVEFVSALFRFVDDVEFLLPDTKAQPSIIHVRSSSRLGYSDLGVNRKRIEQIRKDLGTYGVKDAQENL